MKKYNLFIFLLLFVFCLSTNASAAAPDFVALSDQLKPAVVNIGTAKNVKSRTPVFPGPRTPGGGGDLFEEFF